MGHFDVKPEHFMYERQDRPPQQILLLLLLLLLLLIIIIVIQIIVIAIVILIIKITIHSHIIQETHKLRIANNEAGQATRPLTCRLPRVMHS